MLVTILDRAGVPIEKLGDSTGPLELDPLVWVEETRQEKSRCTRHDASDIAQDWSGSGARLRSSAKADYAAGLPASGTPSPWKKFFPAAFATSGSRPPAREINAVIGGSGPPVLMFHGAPQSLITWRLIAPDLAKDYTLVMCDLRGYGDSSRPAGGGDHSDHSKRPMALDGVEVMEHLGYNQFRMVGHDRGGRVGRRMALDHPDKVQKLAVMDIVPAHYLYTHVTIEFVQAYFHWFNDLTAGAKVRRPISKCRPSERWTVPPTTPKKSTGVIAPSSPWSTPCARITAPRPPSI